jgi:hypothetical protein
MHRIPDPDPQHCYEVHLQYVGQRLRVNHRPILLFKEAILIRACVVATGGSKDYGFTLFASQLNEMEEDVASTDSRFRLGRFSIILWRMRCLFHEVWDTTEYTE